MAIFASSKRNLLDQCTKVLCQKNWLFGIMPSIPQLFEGHKLQSFQFVVIPNSSSFLHMPQGQENCVPEAAIFTNYKNNVLDQCATVLCHKNWPFRIMPSAIPQLFEGRELLIFARIGLPANSQGFE